MNSSRIRCPQLLLLALLMMSQFSQAQDGTVGVLMSTSAGDIYLHIDTVKAPLTGTNFLRYVDAGFYDGGMFHRTVRLDNQPANKIFIEVVQASINPNKQNLSFPPIALERTSVTGLKHVNGTVSMARSDPNSATSDIFICIGDQPSLDYGGLRNPDGQGFAAFGHVAKGMEIVIDIQKSPSEGQMLSPNIKILKVRRIAAN